MNDNDTALFLSASKDFALKSFPHNDENGLYIFSNGQRIILNKKEYQDLRLILFDNKNVSKEIENLQKSIVALSTPIEAENERFRNVEVAYKIKIQDAENKVEGKDKELKDFDLDMSNRNFQLHESTSSSDKSVGINDLAQAESTNWKSLIVSFVSIELLMTGLLYTTMRDFLSLQEIIFRSAGIFVIFICIQQASRLKKKFGKTFTYYQIFALTLLLSAIFLNPAFSVLYPLESSMAQENIWNLQEPIASVKSINPTPTIVSIYRKFSNIEAVITLLCFFALRQFIQPKQTIKDSASSNSASQSLITPIQKLKSIRISLEKEIEKLKVFEEKLKKDLEYETLNHQSILTTFWAEIEKYNSQLKKLEVQMQESKIKFDNLFDRLLAEMESYAVEFRSNLMKDSKGDGFFTKISWPNKKDVFNYLIKS